MAFRQQRDNRRKDFVEIMTISVILLIAVTHGHDFFIRWFHYLLPSFDIGETNFLK